MILVGNKNRAVHHSAKKGRLFADYNELWQELGARPRPDGDFELLCENLPMPVMEDIASKKRSEMRKRHDITLAIIDSLRDGLDTHRRAANDTTVPANLPSFAAA